MVVVDHSYQARLARSRELRRFGIFIEPESSKQTQKRTKVVFGGALGSHARYDGQQVDDLVVPRVLVTICEFLRKDLSVEGLFRVNGSASRLRKGRAALTAGLEFPEGSMHDHAGLLKQYLRELRDPLLTHRLYDGWVQVGTLQNPENRWRAAMVLCQELPRAHLHATVYLLRLLYDVCHDGKAGRMTSGALAAIFAPNVLRPESSSHNLTTSDKELLNHAACVNVFRLLIDHAHEVGQPISDIQSALKTLGTDKEARRQYDYEVLNRRTLWQRLFYPKPDDSFLPTDALHKDRASTRSLPTRKRSRRDTEKKPSRSSLGAPKEADAYGFGSLLDDLSPQRAGAAGAGAGAAEPAAAASAQGVDAAEGGDARSSSGRKEKKGWFRRLSSRKTKKTLKGNSSEAALKRLKSNKIDVVDPAVVAAAAEAEARREHEHQMMMLQQAQESAATHEFHPRGSWRSKPLAPAAATEDSSVAEAVTLRSTGGGSSSHHREASTHSNRSGKSAGNKTPKTPKKSRHARPMSDSQVGDSAPRMRQKKDQHATPRPEGLIVDGDGVEKSIKVSTVNGFDSFMLY